MPRLSSLNRQRVPVHFSLCILALHRRTVVAWQSLLMEFYHRFRGFVFCLGCQRLLSKRMFELIGLGYCVDMAMVWG